MRGWAVFAAVTLSIVVMASGVVVTIHERRAACERVVVGREDARAMWLATFDLFPESDEVMELRIVLDDRLPRLLCDGSTPTPIPEEPTP